jgi:NAD(P)-dependent dehydrogenase (short-subunit alcohol dehydrogenase family)
VTCGRRSTPAAPCRGRCTTSGESALADLASRLRGRTGLVTGGGNGLGRAITLALAAAEVRVVAVGRSPHTLAETAALAATTGGEVRTETADVADAASVADLAARLADEEISILVNNAGVPGPVAPLVDVEPGDWDDVFAVNVRGMFLVCRAFLPPMIERGAGDVINVGSVSGKRPLAGRTPYCASKMAVLGLTTTLAAEVGPHGVTVNSLSPGPVRGPRMDRNFRLEAARLGVTVEAATEAFVSRSLLHRLVEAGEVGQAVVAMLLMPGLHAADIDLSAGMVAR